MKRTVLLLLALTALVLAACSGKKETKSDEPVNLRFAFWDVNQKPGMEAIIDEFEAANPGITVSTEVTGWSDYWTKLEAGATAGSSADIFWMHVVYLNAYTDAGLLLPLDDIVNSGDVDLSKYPQGLSELYTVDESVIGVPKDFDTIALAYNKDIFDAAGEAYPDDSWDWDKLLEVALRLTDKDNGIYGFSAYNTNQEGWYNTVVQAGGEVVTHKADGPYSGLNTPEAIDGIKFYTDMIHVHGVSPNMEDFTEVGVNERFANGQIAMAFIGSWMIPFYRDAGTPIEFAVIPRGKVRGTIYNGLAYSGSVGTKHPEAVKKFIAFASSQRGHELQAEYLSAIPAYEGMYDLWAEKVPTKSSAVYVEMLNYAVPYPFSKTRSRWELIEKDGMAKIFNGELSVEEAVAEMAEKINAVMEKERS